MVSSVNELSKDWQSYIAVDDSYFIIIFILFLLITHHPASAVALSNLFTDLFGYISGDSGWGWGGGGRWGGVETRGEGAPKGIWGIPGKIP